MTNKEQTFSWQALGRIVAVALGVYLAVRAIDVLVAVLMALMIATALFPFVKSLRKHLSLAASAIIVFACVLSVFLLLGYLVLPDTVGQIPSLVASLHSVLANISWLPEQVRSFDAVAYFAQNSGNFLASTESFAFGVVAVITVFFMAFYLVLDNERFIGFFLDLFPVSEHKKVKGTLMEIARVNGMYIRGNFVISIICSLYLFTVLAVLHVPFAAPLAIFAGILDLLPLVGSTLGTLPAFVIAFAVSPVTALIVLIFHLIYQQLENVVISPAIYNKALDISPALSFLSVVVGGGLFGILGAFLALPIAASLPAVVRYVRHYQHDVQAQ